MDTKLLEDIGLTKGEINTYLALLKLGSNSTGPIAKESQVSRSKLYIILDKLEKKGLVSHIEQRGVIYFQAVEPKKIKQYINEKEKKLKELQNKFDKFLPQLETMQKFAGKVQKVRVYQGTKGLITAHEHSYLTLKRGDEYYALGIPKYQPSEHHLYWQRDHIRRVKAGITIKMLFNRDTDRKILKNRNSYKGADARYMPTDIKTPAYFMIYNTFMVIVIASKDPLTIEIESREIIDSFKEYFKEFWKLSKPFKQ